MQHDAVINTHTNNLLFSVPINLHRLTPSTTSTFHFLLLMDLNLMKLLLSYFLALLLLSVPCSSQLSADFYSFSCPNAEPLVRDTVRTASDFDSTIPGKLLRLFFHDCLVQVQLDSTTAVFDKSNENERGFLSRDLCVSAGL